MKHGVGGEKWMPLVNIGALVCNSALKVLQFLRLQWDWETRWFILLAHPLTYEMRRGRRFCFVWRPSDPAPGDYMGGNFKWGIAFRVALPEIHWTAPMIDGHIVKGRGE